MINEFTATRAGQMRQVYVLLLFGLICLACAWLIHPDPYHYPVGVLLFGLGCWYPHYGIQAV
ncbi:hypothetical protein KDW_48140 [Dictyobacter vulcani]|uniref:Uncharacterized protein n=1 Tax=Dictyobacter vulcani TaxID=2607529 RepID=A0A5J4KTZ3_9CHLR|nr:hypothetical protein [Dictyobacter vulcani]GER90652.1 hypothetical protein KDW_48140 [Dictyobacter vulcani]